MDRPDDRCAAVAAAQHGCISFRQARACGLSGDAVRRRVARRRWRRLLPDVYALAGTPETREQALSAALLWGGDEATGSGSTAAALWRMPGFRLQAIEIAGCPGRRSGPEVKVHRVALDASERAVLQGFSVTTPERTLADIAGRLAQDTFDTAFHYCLHTRLTTLDRIRAAAERHGRRAGAARLRRALDLYAGDARAPGSPLEGRLARCLEQSGLPCPRRQLEVRLPSGRRYLDFAWPARMVAVEVDGYRWHSSRRAWRDDRVRLAELRRRGWTVVHVTAEDLAGGARHVLGELREILRPPS